MNEMNEIYYNSIIELEKQNYNVNIILYGSEIFRTSYILKLKNDIMISEIQIYDNKNDFYNDKSSKIKVYNVLEKIKKFFMEIKDDLINIILSETNENGLCPSYFGLFPTKSSLKIIKDNLQSINTFPIITQKTPLHITILFNGNRKILFDKISDLNLNKISTIKVLGLYKNKAGYGLKIENDKEILFQRHITLCTYDGYKPVDVGILEHTEFIPNEYFIDCIYVPYF